MRLTIGQKAARVVRLLLGLRNRKVARALAAHGFTEDDLLRGWDLLRRLTRGRLDAVAPFEVTTKLVEELDAWENLWFPIVSATLANNFPDIHASVFRNITQTTGPEVVVTVGTLIERLEGLAAAKADGGFGREGKAARDLLARRGVTPAVVDEAKALLAKVPKVELTEPDLEAAEPADDEDERALWGWYLEWSTIARTVIRDRRLLRTLGFLQSRPSGDPEAEEPVDEEEPSDDLEPNGDAA